MFRDAQGREYFDGQLGPDQSTVRQTPFSTSVQFAVRLPRHLSRHKRGREPGYGSDADIDFPKPGATLHLRACPLHLLPFYWSTERNQLVPLSTNEILMEERFSHMMRVLDDPYVFGRFETASDRKATPEFEVTVCETSEHRRATAAVTLKPSTDAFWSAYARLALYRLTAWNEPVTQLVLSVPRPRDFDDICAKLHDRLVLSRSAAE